MKTSLLLIILSIVLLIFVAIYTKNTILIVGIVIFIIILLLFYFSKSDKYLTGISDATKLQSFDRSKLISGASTNIQQYTHSIWFYLKDFSDNTVESVKLIKSAPISIDLQLNGNIQILINPGSSDPETCIINNYPLQTWTNLTVSRYTNILDIYLDGKLVKTCHVTTAAGPAMDLSGGVKITPNGGFIGQTANYKYINNSINPQQAYNLYRDGAGETNNFSNILSKYKLKISYLIDNVEQKSLVI